MSVRRLAPDSMQPASFAFDNDNKAWLAKQVAKYPQGRQWSAVIPALWQAQKQAGGWLPRAAIEHVAAELNMPNIRVMEVATFYTMFNLQPVGTHFIQLCGTICCQINGAESIKAVCRERIGPQSTVSSDGKFSWLEVECLGACCNAPMVQINDDYYEDLTPENFRKLLDDLAAGKPVKKGSQVGRHASEPQNDVKTLKDPALYDGSAVGAWKKGFDERIAAAKAAAAAAEAAKAAAGTSPAAAPARPPSPAGAPTNAQQDTPAAGGTQIKQAAQPGQIANAASPASDKK